MATLPPDYVATYQRVFSLWTDDAFTGLSPAQRDFIIANVCLNECMNGGLVQYYNNSYGDRAKDAVDIFRRIGAHDAAKILERANRLLGAAGPDADQDARMDQLEALSDAASAEIDELSDKLNASEQDVRAAAYAWLKKHNG